MQNTALTSLAILKVNWDTLRRDYVENFVSLVVECLRMAKDDVVSLPLLKSAMQAEFGLDIPLNPLKQILQRAAKRRYVHKSDGIYYRNMEACQKTDFRNVQQKVSATYSDVINKLRSFAESEHGRYWSDDDADNALQGFLGKESMSFLFTTAERDVLMPAAKRKKEAPFIVGSFIVEAQKSDARLFEDIETLAKGHLLANALYYPDTGRIAQRFHKTHIYLDTSIIVYAAGFAGAERAAPCIELLDLLRAYGADLCCFQITVDEVRGILDACAARLQRGRLREAYGPTIEYFIENNRSASDVELMAARLPTRLAELTVRIVDKPSYEREYQIDESGFEQALEKGIGYRNPQARIHDVDCISAIARLRRGRASFDPELSRALFVTSNSLLARITREFFQKEESPGAVALCMTDYALGNLLWLKNPTKAPNLPRRRIIADACASMQPSDDLWKRYLHEIAKLQDGGQISSDDYFLLRFSLAAKASLMDLTDGEDEAFTDGTVMEILDAAKENVRRDLKEKLDAKEFEQTGLERKIEELLHSQERQNLHIYGQANYMANLLSGAVGVLILIVLAAATAYSFPWDIPRPTAGWFHYLLAVCWLVLLVVTLFSYYKGTRVKDVQKRLRDYLTGKIEHLLRRFWTPATTNQKKCRE